MVLFLELVWKNGFPAEKACQDTFTYDLWWWISLIIGKIRTEPLPNKKVIILWWSFWITRSEENPLANIDLDGFGVFQSGILLKSPIKSPYFHGIRKLIFNITYPDRWSKSLRLKQLGIMMEDEELSTWIAMATEKGWLKHQFWPKLSEFFASTTIRMWSCWRVVYLSRLLSLLSSGDPTLHPKDWKMGQPLYVPTNVPTAECFQNDTLIYEWLHMRRPILGVPGCLIQIRSWNAGNADL